MDDNPKPQDSAGKQASSKFMELLYDYIKQTFMYKLVTDELKGKVSSRQLLRSENTAKKSGPMGQQIKAGRKSEALFICQCRQQSLQRKVCTTTARRVGQSWTRKSVCKVWLTSTLDSLDNYLIACLYFLFQTTFTKVGVCFQPVWSFVAMSDLFSAILLR